MQRALGGAEARKPPKAAGCWEIKRRNLSRNTAYQLSARMAFTLTEDKFMKLFVFTTLVTFTGLWAQSPSQPRVARGYFSQIASGGGWKTTLTLFNFTAAQTDVMVLFRAGDGSALSLPLVVTQGGARLVGTSSEVSRVIQPLATLVIESEATAAGNTFAGWAEVISERPVSGAAIFRQRGQDGRTVEAVGSLDSTTLPSLVVPFDNRDGVASGVALVNPTGDQVLVIARSRNENGIELDQARFLLPPWGHTAFVLGDRFPSSTGLQGTFEFLTTRAGERLTGLGLRFSASGGFTSIPVLHLPQPLATQP
jgi:hypothetical protein